MKTNRRFLSFLLSLALVLGMMPGMSLMARAEAVLFSGSGTENDPYLIRSSDDWNTLATTVNSGTNYSGKVFKLTNDITVSQMIGQNAHPTAQNKHSFSGTFDGDGHTLTLNINEASTHAAAPFSATNNATIRNLKVGGSVTGEIHSSGLVGVPNGTLTVENCTVSATVSSSATYLGGFVGHGFSATIKLTSCTFNGKLESASSGAVLGGMIGWSDSAKITVKDSLFSGTYSPATANFNPLGYCVTNTSTATLDNFSSTIPGTGGNNAIPASGTTNQVISYIDAQWNAAQKQVIYTEKTIPADQVTSVTGNATTWTTGWYIVNQNITTDNRYTVKGNVKLILANGCTLNTTKGVSVDNGNSFTVYAQTTDKTRMGTLQSRYGSTTGQAAAGIGGSGKGKKAGAITINGGQIKTSGSREAGGAGIGGGFQASGTNTVINGGVITIPARKSVAGIGGGREASSGNITINGGEVNAGGYAGAAIGGGYHGSANTITINGGTVKATDSTRGAAIGSGERNNNKTNAGTIIINGGTVTAINNAGSGSGGAAIGGGYNVPGGTIRITGGTVTATSIYGAGIGGGPGANGGNVTITGGTVTAYSSGGGAGIGAGKGKSSHGSLTIATTHVTKAGDSEAASGACFNYASHRRKWVKIWPHTHSVIESGIRNGNVLYAKCANTEGCNMVNGEITLTLDAQNKLYDGAVYDKAKTTWTSVQHNNWEEISKITGKTFAENGAIQYEQNGTFAESGVIQYEQNGTLLAGAPTNAGAYVAKLPFKEGSETKYLEKAFEIIPLEAYFTAAPTINNLTYTGSEQELITAGTAKNGTAVYKLDGAEYGDSVPKGTNAGTYTVWCKVQPDQNAQYTEKEFTLDVTIGKGAASELTNKPTANTFTEGTDTEEKNLVIAPSSVPTGYELQYALGEDAQNAPTEGWSAEIPKGLYGTYYVWFKAVSTDGNREDTAPELLVVQGLAEPEVLPSAEIIQAPEARELYYNGNPQELITAGTASNGTMMYLVTTSYSEDEDAPEDQAGWTPGIPTKTEIGLYYVWYKAVGTGDYTDSAPEMIPVRIEKGAATITQTPSAKDLTYTGQAQELVNQGTANGGTILYALGTAAAAPEADAENIPEEQKKWSTSIPTATDAGTYYVWYMVAGDANHVNSTPECIIVIINESTGTYTTVSVTGAFHVIGDGTDAVIIVKRSENDALTYKNFESVSVGGKAVAESNYAKKEGSLILTLKAAYLDTLAEGDHKVDIIFSDGSAETTLRIAAMPDDIPKTGDNFSLAACLLMLVLGILGICGVKMSSMKE